jgi:hypothetical protein
MKNRILELWEKGYASGSIAIITGIKERHVRQFLNDHGLKRTVTEAREIRKKNGIPFHFRGHDNENIEPFRPRTKQNSLYDLIETEGGLSEKDLKRALEL